MPIGALENIGRPMVRQTNVTIQIFPDASYWMKFRRHLITELREVEERILGLPVEKRALRRAARQ
jgi:hypothetical protein